MDNENKETSNIESLLKEHNELLKKIAYEIERQNDIMEVNLPVTVIYGPISRAVDGYLNKYGYFYKSKK